MPFDNTYTIAYCEGLRPDKTITVSEWADKYRMLPEGSAMPGPWKTSQTPYLQEVMDVLSVTHPAKNVVFMSGTQIGKTECGNNWLGYVIDVSPGFIMFLLPTVEMVADHSKDRVAPMIALTPRLKAKVSTSKSRDSKNTIKSKSFKGGKVYFGGANSAATLSSKPVRNLYLDEVDRYPEDVDGEGDPVGLARKRSSNFSNRKELMTSTPVDKATSRIEPAYLDSDQRKYMVPCPHCSEKQVLIWEQLKFEKDKDNFLIPGSVFYECEYCKCKIEEHQKTKMLACGEWFAFNSENIRAVGFWINALYSPVGWLSWDDIVREFLEFKRTGDPLKLKQWRNTRLAQTWEIKGEEVNHSTLFRRREKYQKVPQVVGVLVAGFDTQDDRVEVSVYGYGKNEESWAIIHAVIPGDTSIPYNPQNPDGVWTKVEKFLDRTFESETGNLLPIYKSCIDTQGHQMKNVADFLFKMKGRRYKIHGINGSGTAKNFISQPSTENKYKIELWTIGVNFAKEVVHHRLLIEEVGGGYIHFNMSFGESFFKQLTAEKLITKIVKGKEVKAWTKPDHVRNEALDTWVYSYVAFQILNPDIEAFLVWNSNGCNYVTGKKKRRIRGKGVKR